LATDAKLASLVRTGRSSTRRQLDVCTRHGPSLAALFKFWLSRFHRRLPLSIEAIQSPRNEPSSSPELLSSSACQSHTLRGDAFTCVPFLGNRGGGSLRPVPFRLPPRQKKIFLPCVPFSQYIGEEGRCMRNKAAAGPKSANYLPVGQISARISDRKLSARSKCTSSQVAPPRPSPPPTPALRNTRVA
jgi:hypothetical protein